MEAEAVVHAAATEAKEEAPCPSRPPRGAECDLFRDTWVRYLGERGARGTATPTPRVWGSRGCQTPVRDLEKVGGS